METAFTGRAAAYVKNRVGYTREAIECVIARANLDGRQIVADLGAGTGLMTRPLLEHARIVYAVEPADDMRAAAEEALGSNPKFRSVAGTAEETGLAHESIDVIACGNAFHYFDPLRARNEADRILRADGRVVLLFHDWPEVPGGFTKSYLSFLQSVTPRHLVNTHSPEAHEQRVTGFFEGLDVARDAGEQQEQLSWDALSGRFLSSSFAPNTGDAHYEPAMRALRDLFDRQADRGAVTLTLRWRCVSATWIR
jgi:SAM-dependent methyltransferase